MRNRVSVIRVRKLEDSNFSVSLLEPKPISTARIRDQAREKFILELYGRVARIFPATPKQNLPAPQFTLQLPESESQSSKNLEALPLKHSWVEATRTSLCRKLGERD
jgi:hypothetical protein